MYPDTIPIKNGITFRNPFAPTAVIAVTRNATNATTKLFHSTDPDDNPIWLTALGANDKPIIIIIGPMTIGGNNLSIQSLPNTLINNANNTYINPAAITPVANPLTPSFMNATAIGVI